VLQPSWAVLDPNDFYHPFRQARLAQDYEMWRAFQPIAEPTSEQDWTILTTLLYNRTGFPRHRVTRFLDALDTLDRLPRLRSLVEETWLLDMDHLADIDRAARRAPVELQNDDHYWSTLDADLIERFTPSRPRQALPGRRAIREAVDATIRSVEAEAAAAGNPEPDPWGAPQPEQEPAGPVPCEDPAAQMRSLPPREEQPDGILFIEDLAGGKVRFDLIVDQATGTQIADAVAQAASEKETTQARAMADLILGQTSTRVTTMVYKATDVEDAPAYHPDRGILTPETTAVLEKLATGTLDMDAAATRQTDAYETSPAIRAYLFGRDWICRWPGCNRRATHCDADHRINHADGGPTTASNMVMLCRHHHNRKTDEQAFYLLDPVTGDVFWLFADGSWVVDTAIGPLAPRQRRWVQTYAQRRQKQRKRAAAQAAEERFERYQERINAPPPPPAPQPGTHTPWLNPPPDEDPRRSDDPASRRG